MSTKKNRSKAGAPGKSKVTLTELFEGYQEALISSLGVSRKMIQHPVAKGDAIELSWIKMLKKYLPKRYQVERAFVIDSDGNLSEQQDLVIFDRHFSLFIFHHEGAVYVPAESVYAVFEIKPEVTKGYLKYAGKKARSVRKLRRTSGRIVQAGDTIENPKPPFEILAGFLALDSKWKDPLGDTFSKNVLELEGDKALQLGCIARHGAFEIVEGNVGARTLRLGRPETSVMTLVLTLTRLLKDLGTVPAIEIEEYARHL